jgi:hypothetical protein
MAGQDSFTEDKIVTVFNNETTFIFDSAYDKVLQVKIITIPAGCQISVFAGIPGNFGYSGDGGPATSATLTFPFGISSDANYIYIADVFNYAIRRVDKITKIIDSIIGDGVQGGGAPTIGVPAAGQQIGSPYSVDNLAGEIYFADRDYGTIYKIDIAGNLQLVINTGAHPGFTGAIIKGIAVHSSGDIYYADSQHHWIVKVSGGVPSIFAGSTQGDSGSGGAATSAQLSFPTDCCLDETNNRLYIADNGNSKAKVVDLLTNIIYDFAGSGVGADDYGSGLALTTATTPGSVAIDAAGNLFIGTSATPMVHKVDFIADLTTGLQVMARYAGGAGGTPPTDPLNVGFASNGVLVSVGVHVDILTGHLLVSDIGNHTVDQVICS